MKLNTRVVAVAFVTAACAGHNGAQVAQYPPVPMDQAAETVVMSAPMETVAAPVARREIKTPPVMIASRIPEKSRESVEAEVRALWASRVAVTDVAVRQGQATVAREKARADSLKAARPARPTGMITARVVDEAIEMDTRWQAALDAQLAKWTSAEAGLQAAVQARDDTARERDSAVAAALKAWGNTAAGAPRPTTGTAAVAAPAPAMTEPIELIATRPVIRKMPDTKEGAPKRPDKAPYKKRR